MRRIGLILFGVIALALAGCGMSGTTGQPVTQEQQQQSVITALTGANTALSVAATGLTAAVHGGAIKPGTSTALNIKAALDAASKALDEAHALLLAGDAVGAQAKIGEANLEAASAQAKVNTAEAVAPIN